MLYSLKKLIPKQLFKKFQPIYHWLVTALAALRYGFPACRIKVIGVTGTKGKSTTVELLSAILEEAGYKTAIASTVHFKIDKEDERNLLKMSMPGRFFLQNLLARAVKANCDYAIIEMTSEGAKLYRHNFIYLNALIFTNISPEHIESHGSYENYLQAKLKYATALEKSWKKNKILVVNGDDQEAPQFLATKIEKKISFSLTDAKPFNLNSTGADLTFKGLPISSKLQGEFNVYNILAAMTLAQALGVETVTIKKAIEKFAGVAGRMEKVSIGAKQDFEVIVDYAHTADSMTKVYEVFTGRRLICVFGATGGGRDKWKREEMGKVANSHCSQIFLTDDDSYDEDPAQITREIAKGIKSSHFEIEVDRRQAIKKAIKEAKTGDVVMITGKGTDPYLMGPNNTKIPWSDTEIAKEELEKALK